MINELDTHRVLAAVDDMRDNIVALEQALIRFDSVNQPPWGKEGPCQRFVAQQMEDLGLAPDIFAPDEIPQISRHPAWLHGRDYTDRPNVVGILLGSGGQMKPARRGYAGKDPRQFHQGETDEKNYF